MEKKKERIINAGLPKAGISGTFRHPFTGEKRSFVIEKADDSKYMTVRYDDNGETEEIMWCHVLPEDIYISDAYWWEGKNITPPKC